MMGRIFAGLCLAAMSTGPALAVPFANQDTATSKAQTLRDGLATCQAITEDAARLACFDQLSTTVTTAEAAQAPTTPGAESAQPGPTTLARQSRSNPVEEFGQRELPGATSEAAFGLPVTQDKRVTQISAEIVNVTFVRDKAYRIELSNGQIWRQLSSDDTRLRVRKNRSYLATVKTGALGSFRMTVEPGGRTLRVRRVE